MQIPFAVERHAHASLTDQVTAGLRRAIQDGVYMAGDTLPTIENTAGTLAISLNVVRAAVARLSSEGLVTARPRRGIEVCPAGQRPWLGHVLYLHWASANSYYEAVAGERMMQQLLAQRVRVTTVQLTSTEVGASYPMVNSALRCGHVQVAMVAGGAEGVDVLLAENEIPFVHITAITSSRSRLARRTLLFDATSVLDRIVEHGAACEVRTMLAVAAPGSMDALRERAERAGIGVRTLDITPVVGLGSPECVERGGMLAMQRFLDAGEPLPDLVYFADDFLARGGLVALRDRRIRIPEDVQVISWANRGLGPVFTKPLTRVEADPVRHGDDLAALAVAALKNPFRKVKAPVVRVPAFVVGETTVIRAVSAAPAQPWGGL